MENNAMRTISVAGEPLSGPFASVLQDGSTVKLKVSFRQFGMVKNIEIELSDEAFKTLAIAMIQAMNLPE